MPRILAIDFGTKRTGIAVTDEMQLIASGLTTVETKHLLTFIKEYIAKEKVELLVVGEPKQRDGSPSQSEAPIQAFLKVLQKECPELKVQREDERFTSKMAVQSMIQGGMKKKKRQNKALIDEISATIILQNYLYSKGK
ncbi:Holliday junction resolvase RuvX [Mesonia sediminis]|uniref:Putative pre-16S rRNA nuclease n=1 Tax=Mesonia sediminis TaxID=1703946 RepID=A0ABW5SCX7_9FLAO